MIYLILAIVSSMLVSVTMRLSGSSVKNNISMLAVNYCMCTALSALFAGTTDFFPQMEGIGFAGFLGVISGALYLGSFVLLQWNIRVNGVVLPATFMKLGVLVPTLLSIVLFGETPGALQLLGMAGAVCAILLIGLDKGQSRAKSSAGLVILLLGGGLTDATSKFYEEWGNPAIKDHYLFYVFFCAFLYAAILCIVKKERVTRWDALFGVLVGIPNYLCSRFLLLSLADLPAVVVYPTFSVGTIILITLIGVFFFRERLLRRQTAAMGIILVALALLNM